MPPRTSVLLLTEYCTQHWCSVFDFVVVQVSSSHSQFGIECVPINQCTSAIRRYHWAFMATLCYFFLAWERTRTHTEVLYCPQLYVNYKMQITFVKSNWIAITHTSWMPLASQALSALLCGDLYIICTYTVPFTCRWSLHSVCCSICRSRTVAQQ